jgi:hypothetical protein
MSQLPSDKFEFIKYTYLLPLYTFDENYDWRHLEHVVKYLDFNKNYNGVSWKRLLCLLYTPNMITSSFEYAWN